MKSNKKLLTGILLVVSILVGALFPRDEVFAGGSDTLTIKAGFYGGPYYEIAVFDEDDMERMATDHVYTYSAADGGNFMRVGYAWGVKLENLIDAVNVDLDSVKYLHFGTTDSYAEIYATFSADTLLCNRYFFPNFINAAKDLEASNPVLDFDSVSSTGAEKGAVKVPTILAIASAELSRKEAGRVLAEGEYKSPAKSDLSKEHKYRLMYGQKGLTSGNDAYNAQTSDKWVYEINIQLDGAPNFTVEKKLIEGEEGKIGSKYEVSVHVDLPDSYDYLGNEILQKLKAQVLEKVQTSYDDSVVKMTDQGNGVYIMEAVGKGDAELKFSYSRSEFGGKTTTASGSTKFSVQGKESDVENNGGTPENSNKNDGDGANNGTDGSGTNNNGNGSNNNGNGSGNNINGAGNNTGGTQESGDDMENSGTNQEENVPSDDKKDPSKEDSSSTDSAKEGEEDTKKGINIGTSDGASKEANQKKNTQSEKSSSDNGKTANISGGSTWSSIEVPVDGTESSGEAMTVTAQDLGMGAVAGVGSGLFSLGFACAWIDFYNNLGKKIGKKRRRKK